MAGAKNKTQPTETDPRDFLAGVEPERRREDGFVLLELFNRVTGLKPQMWGPSIIGYGRYAYRYESGREGEFMLTGFSPRKSSLNLYIMPGYAAEGTQEKLARLGKHKLGKSCLYINSLADVDSQILAEIIADGVAEMRRKYQAWDA